MRRDATVETDVGIENHGRQIDDEGPTEMRLDVGTKNPSSAILFGSLNEYRHKRLRRKGRQLLPNHSDVVGQLVGCALDGGGLREDKGP